MCVWEAVAGPREGLCPRTLGRKHGLNAMAGPARPGPGEGRPEAWVGPPEAVVHCLTSRCETVLVMGTEGPEGARRTIGTIAHLLSTYCVPGTVQSASMNRRVSSQRGGGPHLGLTGEVVDWGLELAGLTLELTLVPAPVGVLGPWRK